MNLKEAFRYQNKLQALLDEAQGILDCDSNVTNVANTYLRHKVMAEAEDETILDLPQTEYAQQISASSKLQIILTSSPNFPLKKKQIWPCKTEK